MSFNEFKNAAEWQRERDLEAESRKAEKQCLNLETTIAIYLALIFVSACFFLAGVV